MTSPVVVPLKREQLSEAAASLARAFQDDPLQTHVFPNPVERAARSPAHFVPLLEYGLRFGTVLTTAGEPTGSAVWLPPGNMHVTDERAAETGLDRLPELLGLEAATRFFAALSLVEPYHRTDVPVDHWYLFVVGVDRKKLSRTPTRPRNAPWSISAVRFRWWAAPTPSGRLSALAEESGADEIMIATTTYDASDRTRSYELVANAFGMGAAGKEER